MSSATSILPGLSRLILFTVMVPIIRQPNIDLRNGNLHGTGMQTLLPKFLCNFTQNFHVLVLIGCQIDVIIGELVSDIDQTRQDLIVE